MLTKKEACAIAIAKGASYADITAEALRQARQVGTVPFNNMIRALNLMTRLNTRDDWVRLAAALTARANAKTKARKGNAR